MMIRLAPASLTKGKSPFPTSLDRRARYKYRPNQGLKARSISVSPSIHATR